jgi:hypothetical protein
VILAIQVPVALFILFQVVQLNKTISLSTEVVVFEFTSHSPHQDIVIFQVQSKLSLLTVFILVQETRVSCLLFQVSFSDVVTNLLVVVVSDISSASNTTTQVCQFTLSTSHHQVELIIGLSGSVLSIVILVQAITSFNVFTSAPASIQVSLFFSLVV